MHSMRRASRRPSWRPESPAAAAAAAATAPICSLAPARLRPQRQIPYSASYTSYTSYTSDTSCYSCVSPRRRGQASLWTCSSRWLAKNNPDISLRCQKRRFWGRAAPPRNGMATTTPSIQELRASAKELCRGERVPDTSTVEEWMAQADACAKHVMLDSTAATEQQDSQSPASSSSHAHGHAHAHEAWDLLMVEEKSTGLDLLPKNQQALGRAAMISRLRDDLSNLVHSVVVHPDICISPQVLTHYISIQATLERPSTLAQVIELARTKPIPRAKSSPPSYRPAQPNAIINSITPELAQQALQVALDARALVAAIDIINASYGTTAFRRAQVLRRGWLPATLMALVPAGAWTVASRLALFQTTIESGTATGLAFVGFLAYAGFTGTLGFVALSTANDQMERVTWASGVPLRERWLREDERAALDAVACAWGFGEVSRRGEEEGAEWDALREWCGAKGMVLDRVSLMQGME